MEEISVVERLLEALGVLHLNLKPEKKHRDNRLRKRKRLDQVKRPRKYTPHIVEVFIYAVICAINCFP